MDVPMSYDAIVVGGGIAGLTAAAYLARAGHEILLLEKQHTCGGLINTFERDGFVYDGGIRALENSGVLFPMLKQLGLELDFVKNEVSIGIEDRVIRVVSEASLEDYQDLLRHFYPESADEINNIANQIRQIMHYMEVQYGIDNPAFLDMREDREYMVKVILPWVVKYALTIGKIAALNEPVGEFLRRFTHNQSLLDIIAQHFFRETPAFFALSYLKIYLDYYYPRGGTARLIEEMVRFIEDQGGTIRTNTEVMGVSPDQQTVSDTAGNVYGYRGLVWAADLKSLYRVIDLKGISDARTRAAVIGRQAEIADKVGNDSVLSLYLGLDLDPSFFSEIATEHFFYTPRRAGESAAGPVPAAADRAAIEEWLTRFFSLTTYEVSCPVLRDRELAPPGKTGLIVSVLFEYELAKRVEEMGWYEEFKSLCETRMIDTLDHSIFPGIRAAVTHQFSSTPLTIERATGNTDGAITGWSFANDPMPAEHRLPKVFSASRTPIPTIVQAGQWTYSPSGLPISILTGKLAADRVAKGLKRNR
jgi:phytoene dehydrogenase-like protein